MWNGSNQRIKALMSARERERLRLTRPIRVERADLNLNFKDADGSATDIQGRALLNEFETSGICLYTTMTLAPNLDLTLTISHPQTFTIQARVVWCQYQPSSSHVVTSKPYAYRVGLAFHFADAAQEEAFKKFCLEMKENYAISGAPKLATVTPIGAATTSEAEPAEDKKAA